MSERLKVFMKKNAVLSLVFLLGLIFLLHISYIPNGFTWLDHNDIENGKAILPLTALKQMVMTNFASTGFYRPLITFLHSSDAAMFKTFAPGYHFTNVLLHLTIAFAAPYFLSLFFKLNTFERLFMTLLVGIHPLGILPTGQISYRPELVFTLFTFMAVFFHVKARTEKRIKYIFFSCISFLLGLLSKETAIVLIPALLIFWEIIQRREQKETSRFILSLYGVEFFIFSVYLFLRSNALPRLWESRAVPLLFPEAIATRLYAFGKLLLSFLNPFQPSLSDATPIVKFQDPLVLLTILILGIIAFAIHKFSWDSNWGKTLILFLLFLTPALNIIPLPRFQSPHYGYSAIALFSMVIILLFRMLKSHHYRTFYQVAISLWVIIMISSLFFAGFRFKTDYTLFAPEVQKDNHFLEAHFYLGNYYLQNNQLDLAEESYNAILHTQPNIIAFHDRRGAIVNLATVKIAQNKTAEAEKLISQVAKDSPKSLLATIAYNRSLSAAQKKDYRQVVLLLSPYVHTYRKPEPLALLAEAYHALHKDKEAIDTLKRTLPLLDPERRMRLEQFIRTQEQGID
jgi:tetratricopeptide (TPR) repeat protein